MNKTGFQLSLLSISLALVVAAIWDSNADHALTYDRSPAQASQIDPAFVNDQDQPFFTASHPASKVWTQAELLERAQELAHTNPKIRVDIFRVYEERHNDGTLLERRAVFPEIQFYSPRREEHSAVIAPTPVEFMAIWVNDSLEFTFAVSTATYRKRFVPARDQWEHPETPNGSWSPVYINPLHHSNTYKAVGADIGPEMPFSIFIDDAKTDLLNSWSGYAFHGTTLSHYEALGTPDSGGCIRLSREDAETLFALLNPKMNRIDRLAKWYGDRDPRNVRNPAIVSLRERMEINIIDPEYMEKNPALADEVQTRYETLLPYLNVSVNADLQRTQETLRRGKHRTITEKETAVPVNVTSNTKTKPKIQ